MIENFFSIPVYFKQISSDALSQEIDSVAANAKFANEWQPHNDTASTTFIPGADTNIVKTCNMELTVDMIKYHVEDFLKGTEQPFIPNSVNIEQSWINVFEPRQLIGIHDHGYAFNTISGVYYHKVPDGAGDIEFKTTTPFITSFPFSSPKYPSSVMCDVAQGMIILFPSWLSHHVKPNNSKDTRISLAFNMSFDYTFYKENTHVS
jgi:uncharacterized protein (TIGR02466 family)